MKNNMVKLEDLEIDAIYKDIHGQFFKFFYDDSTDSPRNGTNVATILTWERDYDSPDENDGTFEEFAEKHGVDISKSWSFDDVITSMKKEGYYAVPVYALHHGVSHYSISDFNDPWDSGVVGVAFCKKQEGLPNNENYLRRIIDREVKTYDAWVNGEIYGVVRLDKTEDIVDETTEWVILDGDNRTEIYKDMLSTIGIDIQDEYQPAVRKVSVILK
jgi:hypothetical protein